VQVASNGGRLVSELREAGIVHHRVALHTRNPLSILRSIGQIKRLVQAEQIELMHAHARIPAWVAERVMRMTGVPFLTTYHGLYNSHWFFRLFTSSGLHTIAVSEDVREHLVTRFGFPSSQVTVIPNGIDVTRFKPSGPVDVQQVLYISRLSGERGGVALTALEAIASLAGNYPRLHLTIVGEGDRLAEVKQLGDLLCRRVGRSICTILGGRGDVDRLMAEFGLVIGVGRVALEAMSSGKPLIVASEYGNQGLLTEANFAAAASRNFSARGATQPSTARTLVSELKKALDAPDEAFQEAKKIRELVIGTYSMPVVVRQVMAVYEQVRKQFGCPDGHKGGKAK
ncbi:MAG: glycosyltransferase family 4 protein, partial [Firmicutes bacterium]|nr:glycosyltransferase family 4 protein [Bacillota bacterium]